MALNVYMTSSPATYYQSASPNGVSDELIPYPSPELVALLVAASGGPLTVDSVQTTIDNVGNGSGTPNTDTGMTS